MYRKRQKRNQTANSNRITLQILCCLLIFSAVKYQDRIPEGRVRSSVESIWEYACADLSWEEATAALSAASDRLRAAPAVTMSWPCNESDSLAVESDSSSRAYSFTSEREEMQVFASCGGTVTSSVDGRIVISHGDGLETVYDGCTDVYVRTLQKVRRGEMIASVRGSGEIRPELGFQILKEQQPVDIGEYF